MFENEKQIVDLIKYKIIDYLKNNFSRINNIKN